MIENALAVIARLFEGIDFRRRWILTISAILATIITALLMDYYTGSTYYNDLDHRVQLIKQLNEIANSNISTDPELQGIYEQTVQDLKLRRTATLGFPDMPVIGLNTTGQFIAGAAIWVMLAITGLFGTFGKTHRVAGFFLFLFVAAAFGGLNALIPAIHPFLNYAVFPVATFFIVGLVLQWYQNRNSHKLQPTVPSPSTSVPESNSTTTASTTGS
jgi:hypothetical protein